jgi:pimeloyl-ACP methyl ester carboxylesterase
MRLILCCLLFCVGTAQAQDTSEMRPARDALAQYVTADDRFVEIDGTMMRIRDQGPRDAMPVVLLHGFTFSLESWDAWADALSDDYRVIRYDLMGHGLTGPDERKRYAPAERAETVGHVLDALEIDSAVLGGNSLGGLAAWRYAAGHPERVRGLVLVSPGAYPFNGVGDEPAPVLPALELYFRTLPKAAFEASLGRIFARRDAVPPARAEAIYDMMAAPGNADAFLDSIREFVLPDPSADLARVEAPTLIMWGTEDRVIPVDHAGRLLGDLPNAHLILYPDTGHVPHEEAPQALKDVQAFLAGIGDRT